MNNLAKTRSMKGLSQAQLSTLSGVSLSSIQKLEQGGGTPRLRLAAKLARILEIPILSLFPLMPVPKRSEGRRAFLAAYSEIIEKLSLIERTRFNIALRLMPDNIFQNLINPLGQKTHKWEDIVHIVYSYLRSIARQARLDELMK